MEYRFEVALSFAGENRTLVRQVAELLRARLGAGKVFLDEWFEAELAGPDAQIVLQRIYGKQTRLVVPFLSAAYNAKAWTQDEWRAIQALERELRDAADENVKRMRILPLRVADGDVDGTFATAIVPDVRDRSPEEIADLVCARLELATKSRVEIAAPRPSQPTPRRVGTSRRPSLALLSAIGVPTLGVVGYVLWPREPPPPPPPDFITCIQAVLVESYSYERSEALETATAWARGLPENALHLSNTDAKRAKNRGLDQATIRALVAQCAAATGPLSVSLDVKVVVTTPDGRAVSGASVSRDGHYNENCASKTNEQGACEIEVHDTAESSRFSFTAHHPMLASGSTWVEREALTEGVAIRMSAPLEKARTLQVRAGTDVFSALTSIRLAPTNDIGIDLRSATCKARDQFGVLHQCNEEPAQRGSATFFYSSSWPPEGTAYFYAGNAVRFVKWTEAKPLPDTLEWASLESVVPPPTPLPTARDCFLDRRRRLLSARPATQCCCPIVTGRHDPGCRRYLLCRPKQGTTGCPPC